MDMYHKEALRQLGLSIKASGDIIATVSQWPESERHAKDAHIIGALANCVRTQSCALKIVQLIPPAVGPCAYPSGSFAA